MSLKRSHWVLFALALVGLGVIVSSATATTPGTTALEADGLSVTIDGTTTPTRVWSVPSAQENRSLILFSTAPLGTDPGEVKPAGALTEAEQKAAGRIAAVVARFEQSPSPMLATAAQLAVWELVGSVTSADAAASADVMAEVAQLLELAPNEDVSESNVLAFESTSATGMRLLGVTTVSGVVTPTNATPGSVDVVVDPAATTQIPSFETDGFNDDPSSTSPDTDRVEAEQPTTTAEDPTTAANEPAPTTVVGVAPPTTGPPTPATGTPGSGSPSSPSSTPRDLATIPIDRLPGTASNRGPEQLKNTPPKVRLSCPVRAPLNQPWQFRSKARDLEGDPLTFVWYRNGMRIPGASGPNLVSKVREYDRFDVVVSDGNKTAEVVRPVLCQGIVFGNSPEDADPPTTSKRTATTPKASPASPETTSTAAVKPQAAGATTTTTPKPSGSSSSNASDDPRAQVSANIARTEVTNLRWQVSDALTLPWANTGGNVANGLWMGALFVALGACVVAISHAPRFARAVSPSA